MKMIPSESDFDETTSRSKTGRIVRKFEEVRNQRLTQYSQLGASQDWTMTIGERNAFMPAIHFNPKYHPLSRPLGGKHQPENIAD
jgi:hypothetical protein